MKKIILASISLLCILAMQCTLYFVLRAPLALAGMVGCYGGYIVGRNL